MAKNSKNKYSKGGHMSNNSINTRNDWFAKYKDLENKILEKNKEIEELKVKEKQLKREIDLAQQK